jgi:uncharacterized membrane protein
VFQVGDVLKKAVDDFKPNAVPFVIASLAYGVCLVILSVVLGILSTILGKTLGSLGALVMTPVSFGASVVVGAFFFLGWYHMALKTIRGEKPAVGDLFSQAGKLIPGAIALAIIYIGVGLGSVFLVVPGVIIAIALFCTYGFLVDKGLGPIEAVKASVAATKGSWLNIFIFGVVFGILMFVGSIPAGLGLLVVGPILLLAHARIYTILAQSYAPAAA